MAIWSARFFALVAGVVSSSSSGAGMASSMKDRNSKYVRVPKVNVQEKYYRLGGLIMMKEYKGENAEWTGRDVNTVYDDRLTQSRWVVNS